MIATSPATDPEAEASVMDLLDMTMGLRVPVEDEVSGIDPATPYERGLPGTSMTGLRCQGFPDVLGVRHDTP